MNKYIDSKIYKLVDNTNGNIYIGSTTRTIEERLIGHERHYKQYLNGKYHYVTSFEIIKNGNYSIELIELFSCINKRELLNREGHYIRTLECVNKNITGRTNKDWTEENKDRLEEYRKEYYNTNKQKINEKYICICGKEASIGHKARHERSKKHIEYINLNPQ